MSHLYWHRGGRFTRSRPDLGDAVFIANLADVDVKGELQKLYTQDPDWNALLPALSDELIGEQVLLKDFLKGFTKLPEEVALQNVWPALSTVVYKTKCRQWKPEEYKRGIIGITSCDQVYHTLNSARNTLVIVTAKRAALPWIDSAKLFQWEWDLYVVFWSADQNLLFVNCSGNKGEYRSLAKAVAGDAATLVNGHEVFRTFAGVNRLRLQNVGLTEQLGRNIRYTGRMGADVEPGLSEVQKRRARKSVLAGVGFKDGKSISVGASRKGRIWAQKRGNVAELIAWCEQTGMKLLDETIDPEELLKGTLEAKPVTKRPTAMPLAIDWPEEVYEASEKAWLLRFDGQKRRLGEVSIELVDPTTDGPIRFAVASERERAELELRLTEENEIQDYSYVFISERRVLIQRGENAEAEDMSTFFHDHPPTIWFADGSSLEGNEHVELKAKQPPYDPSRIVAWDWTGTDLRKESQDKQKDQASIQARMIRELEPQDYSVIVDDHGKGEVADVVAIRIVGNIEKPTEILAEFYHCKRSHSSTSGQRIEDLYEVCGQAQKCVSWMATAERQTDIFTHLLRREERQVGKGEPSRIELGDAVLLRLIRDISRVRPMKLKVFIVQPGLSKQNASRAQLELLSVTDNHLMETYQIEFGIIANF